MLAATLALWAAAAAAAQADDDVLPPVRFPPIVQQGSRLQAFVPQGWKLEASARGDLNGDKVPDAAMVLHMSDPANLVANEWSAEGSLDTNPRMLLIVFAVGNGGFRLVAADHSLIPRRDNPNQDDPFDSIAIANNVLRLKMHVFMSAGGWWMGNYEFAFRWQDNGFKLIGYDRNGVKRNSGETDGVSINFVTGRMLVTSGSIENDKTKVRRTSVGKRRLIDLAEVGDGLSFSPEGQ